MLFLFFLSLSFFLFFEMYRPACRAVHSVFAKRAGEKAAQPKVSEGRKEEKETVRVSFRVQ